MAIVLIAAAFAAPQLVRESRLAAGTVVGVTIRTEDPARAHAAADAAYAAIERYEAELSEWRADSAVSRLNRGETVVFSAEGDALFRLAEDLRVRSGGAFALAWRGGTLARTEAGWSLSGGPVGLGGILKGFLADRAADALAAAGETDFLVDAAGDIVARGDGPHGRGWRVEVESEGERLTTARLRDEALSTSGGDQQPGHIRDPRTGAAVTCTRVVSVVAPRGEVADGLATALFATCGEMSVPEGAAYYWVGADGTRRISAWRRGSSPSGRTPR